MSVGITEVGHVNVTVPAALEESAKHFYGVTLGLSQLPKPEGPRKNVGAWYQLPGMQLHLSVDDKVDNAANSAHVCYHVADLSKAELHFQNSGIEVIRDPRPVEGAPRFFVRDPGGNLIEIAQKSQSGV